MLCFKDQSFCEHAIPGCPRALTDQVRADARRWWGGDGAPISVINCGGKCQYALKKDQQ
jgi:hypothetical protein